MSPWFGEGVVGKVLLFYYNNKIKHILNHFVLIFVKYNNLSYSNILVTIGLKIVILDNFLSCLQLNLVFDRFLI